MSALSSFVSRLLATVFAIALLGSGGAALATNASATTPRPILNYWTTTPANLGWTGGPVTLSVSAQYATTCQFSSSPSVGGLPMSVSCASGTASIVVNLPINNTSRRNLYVFRLTVTGPGGSFTPGAQPVTVAATPRPEIPTFSATPAILNSPGGVVTATASVAFGQTCQFTSSPKLAGLPVTVPCSGGTATTAVNIPPNTGVQPVYYFIYITAYGIAQNTKIAPFLVTVLNSGASSGGGASQGYWTLGADGGVFSFGDANFFGSTGSMHLNAPVVGITSTPDGGGYWFVARDGGVFSFGDAHFFGSTGSMHLNAPVVAIASTPDGGGYYLVASDGGIFAFGDAHFYGSMGGQPLRQPIVGIAVDTATGGYWEVAADGGIFNFNAPFLGSAGATKIKAPIVGIAGTADGGGYWLAASDGGVLTFGDAHFYGSMGGKSLNQPIEGIAATTDGGGYRLVAPDGGVFCFGDAIFLGSMGGQRLNAPMVGITTVA